MINFLSDEYISKRIFLLSKTKKRDLFYLSFLLFVGIIFEMLSLSILFPIFELLLEPDLANKYTFYNDLLLFFDNPSKNNVVIIVMLLLTFIFFVKKSIYWIFELDAK